MMMDNKGKLLILYATQTGNALDAAERIGREAERRGSSVSLLSMDQYEPSSLSQEDTVVFVVSTTGQGDTPDPMKEFWRFLLLKSLSKNWLEGVYYAVFGLGDSGYQKYNFVSKKLHKRLLDLGATALVEKGLGDDQHPSGYEGALDPWMVSLWGKLVQVHPNIFPNGMDPAISDTTLVDQPKVKIVYHDLDEMDSQLLASSDLECIEMNVKNARSMSPGIYSRAMTKPDCFITVIKNQQLTRVGFEKDVRHLEFEFVSNAVEYEVGDVIEVLPGQRPAAIDAFIKRCNLDPESLITVHEREMGNHLRHSPRNGPRVPIKLKTFVELTMDVASASPRRHFFEVMSFFARAEHERERLQYFVSPEGRDDLYNYNKKEGRTVLEVLEDFPSVQMPFEWLVQLVPPLKTRAFSISSSLLAHPNQVHLVVDVVSWTTPYKRKRTGLCSTWLARLDPQQSVYIPAWVHKGFLPRPLPSLPLILVGPGTGCAPFRGFVEERDIQSLTAPTAPITFFFGCRNEDADFLYKNFWLSQSENDKVLSESKGGGFFAAFSRDQPHKVYVQHKMREQSRRLWNLLNDGATIYVAGSSTKMPADVLMAFEEIVSKESGLPRESVVRWLRALERAGKYHVEAWS